MNTGHDALDAEIDRLGGSQLPYDIKNRAQLLPRLKECRLAVKGALAKLRKDGDADAIAYLSERERRKVSQAASRAA